MYVYSALKPETIVKDTEQNLEPNTKITSASPLINCS